MNTKKNTPTKSISDMTQEELMEFIYCLNQAMINYENDVESLMSFSDESEWERLKNQHVRENCKVIYLKK